ncbi:MAG: VTT domain-containing protein [Phycisphaerales bacterium]
MSEDSASRSYSRPIIWVSVAVTLIAIYFLLRALPVEPLIEEFKSWVGGFGVWGPAALAGVYVVWTVFMLPGSALTLAAGALFGLFWGTLAVSIGATTGATIAFLIARYVARSRVERMVSKSPKFDAIDQAIRDEGWKIVALLRLSPAVPFNLQNYFYGLTAIRLAPYVVASYIFMLPGTFVFVYIGHIGAESIAAAAASDGSTNWLKWGFYAVGLAATIAVTWFAARLAWKAIAERTDIDEVDRAQTDNASESAEGRPLLATIAVVCAVASVSLAAVAHAREESIERFIVGLFGPPPVVSEEAYEPRPDGPTFDHGAFDELLRRHVRDGGWVDYSALQSDADALDRYIESLANASFDELGRNEKLALLINGYNAFTLRLILDFYPVESIRRIPSDERWEAKRWNIGGEIWSLDEIEHEQIRPKFKEPRIHFALVCAAVGCPPLRAEVYEGARLDEQLESQTSLVHSNPRWFRFDSATNRLELTKLYDWYGSDFESDDRTVIEYAAQYSPALRDALDRGVEVEPRWIDYDWSLNDVTNRPDR